MNADRQLKEKLAELDLLRSKIDEIDEMPEPDGDEALRSQIVSERLKQLDNLVAQHKAVEEEIVPLQDRANELEAIRSSARDQARTSESGDGAVARGRYLGGTAPQHMSRVDPYEPQQLEIIRSGRFDRGDVIGRARKAIEMAPRHLDTKGREHAEKLLGSEYDDVEGGNRQAPLIARHMLLTGSPEYHRQFQEYARTGYPGELLRANMSLTDSAGGFHLVAAAAA